MKKSIFFFFLLFSLQSFSQRVAIKNNLVYDALLTPNLSLEFSLGEKWTLDTQVGMNFSSMRTIPPQMDTRQGNGAIGLCNPRYAIGLARDSTVGFSGCTRMEAR